MECNYEGPDQWMDYVTRSDFESLPVLDSHEHMCPEWYNNTAGNYGDALATYFHHMQKVIWNDPMDHVISSTEGVIYYGSNHTSGTPIPRVNFTLLDSLDQGPAAMSDIETIEVVMWSPDGLFPGVVSFLLREGIGSSPLMIGLAAPGMYTVVANFSVPNIQSFVMRIRVRECVVGESAALDGTVCQPCSTETYNFHPNEVNRGCTPCPDDAVCDAAYIRPSKGYWHKTPCSLEFQECLSETACDFDERDAVLINLTLSQTDCNFSNSFVQNYGDDQCREVSPKRCLVDCEFWD